MQIPPVLQEPFWKTASPIIDVMEKFELFNLHENVRQAEDPDFRDLLNRMRLDSMTNEDHAQLEMRSTSTRKPRSKLLDVSVLHSLASQGFEVGIFATHQDIAVWNQVHLDLMSDQLTFISRGYSTSEKLTPVTLKLKKGARVMMVANQCGGSLPNGLTGVIQGFKLNAKCEVDKAAVKWEGIPETLWMEKTKEKGLVQFPFRLAWGVTAHKVQGATFSKDKKILIDCTGFTPRQRYVAFSRVQLLNQITITNYARDDLAIDHSVSTFLTNLMPLSLPSHPNLLFILWTHGRFGQQLQDFLMNSGSYCVIIGAKTQHDSVLCVNNIWLTHLHPFKVKRFNCERTEFHLHTMGYDAKVAIQIGRSARIDGPSTGNTSRIRIVSKGLVKSQYTLQVTGSDVATSTCLTPSFWMLQHF